MKPMTEEDFYEACKELVRSWDMAFIDGMKDLGYTEEESMYQLAVIKRQHTEGKQQTLF